MTMSKPQQTITPRLFTQPWWLDAVAPGAWGEAVVKEDNHIVARWPYVHGEYLNVPALTMPPLTQYLGPELHLRKTKYAKQLGREKSLLCALLAQFPDHDYFCQSFHHSVSNWLPLYWQGFNQTTFYTYRFEDLSDTEAIWKEMLTSRRTDVRKAEKKLTIRTDLGLDAFLELNARTFARQDKEMPYSCEFVERIDAACDSRGVRKIFFAVDASDRPHAAIYMVWDKESAYYLMGGADPETRDLGGTTLALWKAICFAATVTQSFDFEGSVSESIEHFFRGFGARQSPYFQLTGITRKLHRQLTARDAVGAVLNRPRFSTYDPSRWRQSD